MDLRSSFIDLEREVNFGYNKYRNAKQQVIEHTDQLEIVQERKTVVEKARAFFQAHAENTQREISETLSVIITSALRSVFPDDYECSIEFGTKRNQTEARIKFLKGDEEIEDPINAVGGGVIDIATFAARVAFIFLSGSRKVLIADEPFKAVSADLRDKIPEMLKLLSTKLEMQFIIVSHLPELIDGADKVVKIKQGMVDD